MAVLLGGDAVFLEALVSLDLQHRPLAPTRSRREQRRLRQALREQDRRAAQLAELHLLGELLGDAARIIERGWLQHGWFSFTGPTGERRVVVGCAPRLRRRVALEQVESACLVGAIVYAGGGPSQSRSQIVQRATDVAWHAGFRGASEPVHWCPSPAVRAAHLMDLVGWNDEAGRTPHEVTDLLSTAQTITRSEAQTLREPRLTL